MSSMPHWVDVSRNGWKRNKFVLFYNRMPWKALTWLVVAWIVAYDI